MSGVLELLEPEPVLVGGGVVVDLGVGVTTGIGVDVGVGVTSGGVGVAQASTVKYVHSPINADPLTTPQR